MTTITGLQHVTDRRSASRSTAPAAPRVEVVKPAAASPDEYRAQDARTTAKLAVITGVASLIILVFFLAMMWQLGSYGPTGA